ncbi:MAG TPA: VanW family protein [Syntrophomonadaceae bacterium]|nr:VanW family protein [Syntrophomonadaceae bacterium]
MYRNPLHKLLVFSLCFFLLLTGHAPAQAQDLPSKDASSASIVLPTIPCTLVMDGQLVHLSMPLRANLQNQSLISIHDVITVFSCHLDFDAQGGLHVHHLDSNIDFARGDYYSTSSSEKLTPLEQLDAFYVPLRIVSEGLGYVVQFNEEFAQIIVDTPAYHEQFPQQVPHSPTEDPVSPPSPPENLPLWGTLGPELNARWPGEKIIAGYYTTLINSPAGRTNNIALSCSHIDGTILQPDQVFSFNQIVGERTVEAGYQDAKIFVGNKVSTGLGGGICQTASTVYDAAQEAGLEIVERHPHSLKVTYVAPYRDATVSWGSADLQFRNNLRRSLKIRTCVYGPYTLAAICEAP